MWKIGEEERKLFHEILDSHAERDPEFNEKTLLQSRVLRNGVQKGLTVDSLLQGNAVSAEEVAAIYKLLPEVEFYKFVDALVPASQTPGLSTDDEAKQATRKDEYRKRIQRLKEQQENREYREMTESVDLRYQPNLMKDFGQEMRSINRQMVAVINTLITVGGAFVFGFYGISMAYPHMQLEMATRMMLGLIFATIVLFADFYFIIKNME